MRITDLNLNEQNRVETHTDAYSVISNEYQRDIYIDRYGNVEIVLDPEYDVYRALCPKMHEKREKYLNAKLEDIRRWGTSGD
jgi:hypothetical protein